MSEFKFTFNIREALDADKKKRFEADETLRETLAKRFDLIELNSLEVVFTIHELEKASLFQVQAHIKADAYMPSMEAGEPVHIMIDEAEEDLFTTREDLIQHDEETGFDIHAPELIERGEIDLADMAFDYLGLMLDEAYRDHMMSEGEAEEKVQDDAQPVKETRKPFKNLKAMLEEKKS